MWDTVFGQNPTGNSLAVGTNEKLKNGKGWQMRNQLSYKRSSTKIQEKNTKLWKGDAKGRLKF